MARTSASQAGNGPTTPQLNFEPMLAVGQQSLHAAAQAQAHALKRMSKVNEEMFRFLDQRLTQDLETAKDFAACKSAQEAIEVCGRFFEIAFKQYSEELGLLGGLYADQTREALADTQHQVEEAISLNPKTEASKDNLEASGPVRLRM